MTSSTAAATPAPYSDLVGANSTSAAVTSSAEILEPTAHSTVSELTPTDEEVVAAATDPPTSTVSLVPGYGVYGGAGGPYGFLNSSAMIAALPNKSADPADPPIARATGAAADKNGVQSALVAAIGFAVAAMA